MIYPTGVFIQSIEQTQTSTEAGGKNIITVTLTNHTQQHFEISNGAKGDTGDAAGIKEITTSIDNGIGVPSVTVTATGTGAEKTVHFDFKNLKGETGNVALTEDVKQHIDNRLAAIKMPLNPVACYDFADVQYKTIFTHGRIESTGDYGFGPAIDLTPYKGKTIKVTASGYRKGKGGYPKLYVYEKGWTWSVYTGNELNSETEKTATITVTLPTKYEKIEALWHHRGYEEAHNTVIVTGFKIETLQNTVIDTSGNGNHSTINGAIAKHKDDSIGTALLFEQGFLSRKSQDFIGVGKQWSHSRWIKINSSEQDKTHNPRIWFYGAYDYSFFDIRENNGQIGNVSLYCYRNSKAYLYCALSKESILDNKWHHLVVMTDLQPSYCRKIVYFDRQKIFDEKEMGDFSDWMDNQEHFDMGAGIDISSAKGHLANLIFFDRFLTETERQWLYLNPYYPAKRYSLAEYKADENRALLEELKKRIPTS